MTEGTPYFADDWLTVYQGDCREVMAAMEPESVHCVVTSPPYWGLRDYGTATWIGGDAGCDHLAPPRGGRNPETAGKQLTSQGTLNYQEIGACRSCGAVREDAQLGLEPTPEAYVENMVAVFREVRRVLRKDGTLWLNLGDSYANGGGTGSAGKTAIVGNTKANVQSRGQRIEGLAQKQLVGIPWRVAFALQADGWYLRSDIIWAKPNPMPESVTDRPTKSHEYLFLLSKSARYFYDAEGVREKIGEPTRRNAEFRGDTPYKGGRSFDNDAIQFKGTSPAGDDSLAGRNLRSVWNIATAPYPGAHFATFPPKLVEPCIKAGTSGKGVCSECGAPWEREVERVDTGVRQKMADGWATHDGGHGSFHRDGREAGRGNQPVMAAISTGWHPTCAHDAPTVPAVVLDPFAGSGTTGMVAQRLSRKAVLIDLNGDYLVQAMARNAQAPLGLGDDHAA